jgi:hypothetical protein
MTSWEIFDKLIGMGCQSTDIKNKARRTFDESERADDQKAGDAHDGSPSQANHCSAWTYASDLCLHLLRLRPTSDEAKRHTPSTPIGGFAVPSETDPTGFIKSAVSKRGLVMRKRWNHCPACESGITRARLLKLIRTSPTNGDAGDNYPISFR